MSVLTSSIADGASLDTVNVVVDAIPVNPATGVADSPQFHIVVGAERMVVLVITGLTMTCSRSEANPVAHPVGEKVGYYDRFGGAYEQMTGSVELSSEGLEAEVEVAPPAPDVAAPAVPTALTVLPGFRGFGANFSASTVADLMFNEIRYAPDLGGTETAPAAPDTANWRVARAKVNTLFLSGLEGEAWYWVQVRSVDTAGNVATSETVSTAVDYLANPEAGWCAAIAVKTMLVGASDIAFGAIQADHIDTGALNASDIGAGTLVVRPLDSFAQGIEVRSSTPAPPAAGTLLGSWDEAGIKIIDPTDSGRYILIDAGEIKLTESGGEDGYPLAITPEGINASKITFGNAPGGHNLVLNSSFELAAFGVAATVQKFDSNVSTPAWASGNRTSSSAPVFDNVTEGTSLTITTLTF